MSGPFSHQDCFSPSSHHEAAAAEEDALALPKGKQTCMNSLIDGKPAAVKLATITVSDEEVPPYPSPSSPREERNSCLDLSSSSSCLRVCEHPRYFADKQLPTSTKRGTIRTHRLREW